MSIQTCLKLKIMLASWAKLSTLMHYARNVYVYSFSKCFCPKPCTDEECLGSESRVSQQWHDYCVWHRIRTKIFLDSRATDPNNLLSSGNKQINTVRDVGLCWYSISVLAYISLLLPLLHLTIIWWFHKAVRYSRQKETFFCLSSGSGRARTCPWV